jgi:hypothetical protein
MRRVTQLSVAVFVGSCLIASWSIRADDADAPADAEKEAARARKERYMNWMRNYAENTAIRLAPQGSEPEETAKLVPNPVFRYSDEPRQYPDATLWVWTRDSRPVAMQKIEVNNNGGQLWMVCFASLSEGLLDVQWPGRRRAYSARTPGLTFRPIPKADSPAETARARTVQLKALKERFAARIGINEERPEAKRGFEARMMPTPLFEYADPESKLSMGAIFGMSITGTNPDLLLLIEARRDEENKWRWEYAHVRMTADAVRLRLDDVEVWAEERARINNPSVFDNWTFYFFGRDFE